MVSIELSGMSYQEKKDWLKKRYPKPLEIIIKDRYGNYDFTCQVHGWCLKEDWDGCEYLNRCWHGRKQSQIDFPSPEQLATMTPTEKIKWQQQNFPLHEVEIKLSPTQSIFCRVWGFCIKEQYENCPHIGLCPEYYTNKERWQEVEPLGGKSNAL
jgi:hypothetical protein